MNLPFYELSGHSHPSLSETLSKFPVNILDEYSEDQDVKFELC